MTFIFFCETFYFSVTLAAAEALEAGEEVADDVGAVGMGVFIGFDGVAQGRVAQGDEEGQHEVGLGIVGRFFMTSQPLLELFDISFFGFFLPYQRGTDEHEGHETTLPVGIIDDDTVVAIEAGEVRGGLATVVIAGFPSKTAGQSGEHLLLEVVQQVAVDEAGDGLVVEEDITFVHVGEGDAREVAQHVKGDGEAGLAATYFDTCDDGLVALPGRDSKCHGITHFDGVDGLPHIVAQLTVAEGVDEAAHLVIGHPQGNTVGVAMLEEVKAAGTVPFAVEYLLDALLVGMDEDVAVEGLTNTVVFLGDKVGNVASNVVFRHRGGSLRNGSAHKELEGDEILQRLGHRVAVAAKLTEVLTLQHPFYLRGIEMCEDVPVGHERCKGVMCIGGGWMV